MVVVFLGICAWMFYAAHQTTGDEGLYSILNDQQFDETFKTVRDMTQQPILDFDSGKKLTQAELDELKKSKELIRRLITYNPTGFPAYVVMAKTERALGEQKEAVRNYEQALLQIPANSTDPNVLWTAAEIRYDLGTYYYESGDLKQAEPLAEEAVLRFPTNARYLSGLAAIKAQLGKFAEARLRVQQALAIDSNDPTARELDAELKKSGL